MKVATLKADTLMQLTTTLNQQLAAQTKERDALIANNLNAAVEVDQAGAYHQNLQAVEEKINKNRESLAELGLYCPLGCDDDPDSLHNNGFGDWMRIKKLHSNFTEKDRKLYEAFVEGWLLYFERHNSTFVKEDRTMFFDWNKKSKGKNDLVIYLKPLHNRTCFEEPYTNMPEKILSAENAIAAYGSNGQKSPMPQPPSTTDPHQPPPPPPPPSGGNALL